MVEAHPPPAPLDYENEHYDCEAVLPENDQRRSTETDKEKGVKRWWYLLCGILVAIIGNVTCLLIICFRKKLGIKRKEIRFFIIGIVVGALIQLGIIIGILAAVGVFNDDNKKDKVTVTVTDNGGTVGFNPPSILGSGFGFGINAPTIPDDVLEQLTDSEIHIDNDKSRPSSKL
ncbi:hypothetical protein BWQ96_01468 [Gracilariopsis chorda]|uniref:Uncharacterized protein n=1 Tax=Gracilariopsis chorda TaxID=448386 RepID=A0A2V3J2D4_9FLOR|nr:hypothetical protein BWQ96_01468 [Gracilariopsis chorda]|eukprot:PXF48616.1 hypothetical protein BWQ96_01468 [Gracilariopsis chorda]